jgi:hypothetical protein
VSNLWLEQLSRFLARVRGEAAIDLNRSISLSVSYPIRVFCCMKCCLWISSLKYTYNSFRSKLSIPQYILSTRCSLPTLFPLTSAWTSSTYHSFAFGETLTDKHSNASLLEQMFGRHAYALSHVPFLSSSFVTVPVLSNFSLHYPEINILRRLVVEDRAKASNTI